MKVVLALFFFIFIQNCPAVGQEKDAKDYHFIWYRDRQLSYDDFKAQRIADTVSLINVAYKDSTGRSVDTMVRDLGPILSTGASLDGMTIGMNFSETDTGAASAVDIYPTYYRIDDEVYYSVYAVFYPNLSFIVYKTPEVLAHEQNHFDICELYARKLKKYLKANLNKANYKDIDTMIENFRQETLKMQRQFDEDGETDYAKNNSHLKSNVAWKKKIQDQLVSLKDYESPDNSLVDGTILLK